MALTKAHNRMVSGSSVNAVDYGAVGDGTTDDTAALQAAITAASGSSLIIPDGNYLVTSKITLSGCTIFGYGAKITSTVSSDTTLSGNTSNIKIYGLEVEGLGNSSYVSGEILIEIEGTNNDPSAPTFLENIEVKDCYLHSVGRAGLKVRYVKNSRFCDNRIEDVGRSGIEASSVHYSKFDGNIVRGMSPGDGSNAYGIFLSKSDGSQTVEPKCIHCTVNGNIVEDNLIWEALDTHGGEFITFANNTIKNCKIGIALVPAEDESGNGIPPKHCSVTGNVMGGINRSGVSGSYGLNIAGNTGFELEHCTITGNVIDAFGNQSVSTSGAIRVTSANDVTISGNVVKRAGCNCIILNSNATNVNISGNAVMDAWSDTEVTRGIFVQASNNTGYIGNNTVSRDTTGLGTNVMDRGVDFGTGSSNAWVTGPNRNTATTPYSNSNNGTVTIPTVQNGAASTSVTTGVSTKAIAVTFEQAFSVAPKVVASSDQIDAGTNSVVVVSVSSVTTTGCNINISTSDRNNFGSAYTIVVDFVATGF
jgi:hypothetical protein|tara:strand:+ start:446 stop:2047 length:1602 start_codon:yes stop_codon:yes gene_type:complete